MLHDRSIRVMVAICTTIAVVAALYFARQIFIPSLFRFSSLLLCGHCRVACKDGFQHFCRWQSRSPLPRSSSLHCCSWQCGDSVSSVNGCSETRRDFRRPTPRWFDGLTAMKSRQRDFIAQYFDAGWITRTFQQVTGRLHGIVTFVLVTLVFLLLGLLEVPAARRKLAALRDPAVGQSLERAFTLIAAQFRRYMLVRTGMSLLTGIAIWGFLLLPVLSSRRRGALSHLRSTTFPSWAHLLPRYSRASLRSCNWNPWQGALLIFMCLNLIQFLVGSYLEPRIAGAALSMSPFLVLFSVFFWMFVWGVPGAFIGVPIMIALITICAQYKSSRWISELLSGAPEGKK